MNSCYWHSIGLKQKVRVIKLCEKEWRSNMPKYLLLILMLCLGLSACTTAPTQSDGNEQELRRPFHHRGMLDA
jgi:hypothetical protein